jgi:pimeloyl-ACP methyl ester carboxylesterase
MKHPGTTPPFRVSRGETLAGSIAQVEYLRLGGVDQWVLMRGEDASNPPLILLHGGPGLSETAFFRYYNASLEKAFTVVYWDQRGAGKSFDPAIPKATMNAEQFIADLDELVSAVCRRVGQSKVTIFGHSWGSALGALYGSRFGDKVAAYVGCGQLGDWAAGESTSYAYALAEAERRGDRSTAAKLRSIGPPPHSVDALFTERSSLARLEGRLGPTSMWKMLRMILGAPESSLFELPETMRAFKFSLEAMWRDVSQLNLIELVPSLRMPVFFFLGRKDHWVPTEQSVAYFEALTAPSKEIVWFEKSGHEPFVDEPARFNAAMVERVRPVVAALG